MYKSFFKRIIDFCIALLAIVILSPVFILVTLSLYFANQGKPFFFQVRPGENGKLFRIIKFRTMNDLADKNGELLPDSERLTAIGTLVRKSSVDELPQLINVLAGQMSIIGPRPLLPEYLPLYSPLQARRHEVKPGITGWAQVNGRNAISWNQKFTYDVWYVDHVSCWLDIKIVMLTIKKVLLKEGISSGSSVTMEKFTGQ